MILDSSAIVAIFLAEPEGERFGRVIAFGRYGKGRHPAALNYGDCLAYATAKVAGLPVLATGDGFAETDLEPA